MLLYGLAFHLDKLRDQSLRITGQGVGACGPMPRWLQSLPGHPRTSCVALTALFVIERRCYPRRSLGTCPDDAIGLLCRLLGSPTTALCPSPPRVRTRPHPYAFASVQKPVSLSHPIATRVADRRRLMSPDLNKPDNPEDVPKASGTTGTL